MFVMDLKELLEKCVSKTPGMVMFGYSINFLSDFNGKVMSIYCNTNSVYLFIYSLLKTRHVSGNCTTLRCVYRKSYGAR
jgi:hypothetical protein